MPRMFPAIPMYNAAYRSLVVAKKLTKFLLCVLSRGVETPDFFDLFSIMGGTSTPFPMRNSAMADLVSFIVFRGIPSKILKAIVFGVTIIMAALHAFWTRADESEQDKTMDVLPTAMPNTDRSMSILFGVLYFTNTVASTYSPLITNLVSLNSRNYSPFFTRHGFLLLDWYTSSIPREAYLASKEVCHL